MSVLVHSYVKRDIGFGRSTGPVQTDDTASLTSLTLHFINCTCVSFTRLTQAGPVPSLVQAAQLTS